MLCLNFRLLYICKIQEIWQDFQGRSCTWYISTDTETVYGNVWYNNYDNLPGGKKAESLFDNCDATWHVMKYAAWGSTNTLNSSHAMNIF